MQRNGSARSIVALAVLAVVSLSACTDQPLQTAPNHRRIGTPGEAVPTRSYHVLANPWSAYDQIVAGSQVPEPDDEVRIRCPEERPVRGRVWKVTLLADQLPGANDPDYMAHFNFAGDKYFIGYVGRADNGDPLADYRIYETVYSTDNRYRAEPYARLTLVCHGRYTRFPGGRVWAGNYLVVAHEGEITFGPAYSAGGEGGNGDCKADYMTGVGADTTTVEPGSVYTQEYDPYDPEAPCSESGGGGPGNGGSEATFPELCSSLGGKLYYDWLCLEMWNQASGSYETAWCGVAAVCET